MIHIETKHLRRFEILDDLVQACKDIANMSEEERKEFINSNSTKWTAIKDGLWILGFGKCWYSEATLQRDGGHVEHFRPKAKVAKHSHTGYWWCAFDWKNFRFSHPTCNIRITDYLDGKLAGKGTYFPLRDEAKRALKGGDQKNEEPLLLDPTLAKDVMLVAFDESSGAVVSRVEKEVDEWKHLRVKESARFYHLNEGTWVAERFEKICRINELCDDLERAKKSGNEVEYESCLDDLCSEIHPFAEFSAVGIQALKTRGLLELVTPGREK